MMTVEQLQAQLAELQAENAKLKASKGGGKLTFKVGAKGGVSVYGINNRFPVTLYKEQWERLLDKSEDLKAFLKANESVLATKAPKAETPKA